MSCPGPRQISGPNNAYPRDRGGGLADAADGFAVQPLTGV